MPPPSRPVPGFGEMQESINFLELFPVDEMIAKIKNLEPVLTAIGAEMMAESRQAFKYGKFGGEVWPQKYNGIPSPTKVNYAGAVADLGEGSGKIKDSRFEHTDPLVGTTGDLRRGIEFEVMTKASVRVGATGPSARYAGKHQWGLESVQDIPGDAIEKIDKQIDKESDEERLDGLHALRARVDRDGSVLTTKVQQRPFLGVTDEMQEMIPAILSKYFDGGADGSPNT